MFESLYRHDGWGVGIIRAPVADVAMHGTPAVEWLPLATRRAFAADPFVIEHDGVLYCFFETLPYATNRGKIAYAVLDRNGTPAGPARDAIVAPFHLSYPFLLRRDGEILCIPEAGESGCVTAYAARAFPDGWYAKRTLIDFPAIDPTVFEYDGRWWMLATDGRRGWNEALHVWYADDPLGRWEAHPRNPVKLGLRGTRPAGRPFFADGRLLRPAQDCTGRYGRRVIVNEILALSPTDFAERELATIDPDPAGPFADGLHTLNGCDGLTVVDGNRLHFVPDQCRRAIAAKIARLMRRPSAGSPAIGR